MISASRFLPPSFRPCPALAALALAFVAATSAALVASTSAAAPLINKGTWIESKSASCPNKISCSVEFTSVPAGRTLIARNISCRINALYSDAPTDYLVLTGNARLSYLLAGPPMNSANSIYVMNSRIFVPFLPAAKPKVTYKLVSVASSLSIACTLSGDLVP